MIKVELSLAVSLYLFFSVIGLLIVWYSLGRKRGLKRTNPEERFVWQCSICTFFYVDSRNDDYSVCPRCGSYNTRMKGGGKG
ncbi:MAG: hypothetical protein HY589_04030 [Candidatus Omnitrophica bacterium]|nr:hypothetical protein [Candidatus Omnitrophota bacterium]